MKLKYSLNDLKQGAIGAFTAVILFFAIITNLFLFVSWESTYTIQQTNFELKDFSGTAICGGFGNTAFFENQNMKCYSGGNGFNEPNIIKELDVDYLVLTNTQKEEYSDFFELKKEKDFTIGKYELGL